MEKCKSQIYSEVCPPPSELNSAFSAPENTLNVKCEPSSSVLPPLSREVDLEPSHSGHGLSSDSTRFSYDVNLMPDNPTKTLGHRRAHSEILTLPDDICFDSDLGVVRGLDGPSFLDEAEEDLFSMYLDMDKFNVYSVTSNFQVEGPSSTAAASSSSTATPPGENMVLGVNERPTRVRHQHSLSMDGSTTIKSEVLMSGSEGSLSIDVKKSLSAANLAELAITDPKRAKRIWANRQSAARSKERKMRYIAELERKVQALQIEATSMSAQLILLQRGTSGVTAENSELKLRLQTTEQQVHLQDALNGAMKDEIQHLKVLTGQNQMAIGIGLNPMRNFPLYGGGNQHSNNKSMHTMLAVQEFQQLHIHSQKQQLHQLEQQQRHQTGDLKDRVSMPSPTPQGKFF